MRVNFSVTNQLATPSIHAAALANRPPAGQPGRLFVDTDNPSSGIYRDTGTVWENITGGAGAGNLQTVTDAGNTTDNNILLTYADNTIANALVFYNDALTQEEYLIEKRGTGITTNDSLAIQSRGNISPSTNPVGFLIDGANDVIKSFYTTSYTEQGIKLDFANSLYSLGNSVDDFIRIDAFNGSEFRTTQGSTISAYDGSIFTQINIGNGGVGTVYNNGVVGLNLDFVNGVYLFGDENGVSYVRMDTNSVLIGDCINNQSGTKLVVSDVNQIINTTYGGSDIGLKLDFTNEIYSIAWNNLTKGLIINKSNSTIYLGDDAVSGTGAGIKIENDTDIYIGDYTQGFADGLTFSVTSSNNTIKSSFQSNDIGLKLDFANGAYSLGDLQNWYVINGGGWGELSVVNDIVGDVNGITVQQVATQPEVRLGDFLGINNGTELTIRDGSSFIRSGYGGNNKGIYLDFSVEQYIMGSNFTNDYFGIDSANNKLIASTNLLVGSSGSASGQHLKIKVGTTDYVIELKNP